MLFWCTLLLVLAVQVFSAPQNGNVNIPDSPPDSPLNIPDSPNIKEIVKPTTPAAIEEKKVDPLIIVANLPSAPINVSASAKPCSSCGKGPLLACPKEGDGECGSGEACCYDSCRARQVCRSKNEIVGYKEPDKRFQKRETDVIGDGQKKVGESISDKQNVDVPVQLNESLSARQNVDVPVQLDESLSARQNVDVPVQLDESLSARQNVDVPVQLDESFSARQNVDVPAQLDEEYGTFDAGQGAFSPAFSGPETFASNPESLSVFASSGGDREGDVAQFIPSGADISNQFQQDPFAQLDDFEEEIPFVFNQAPQQLIPVQQPVILPPQYIPDNEDDDDDEGGFFDSLFG